jgi:hypothetical protein
VSHRLLYQRAGAGVLALAGIFFALYPLLRPWHNEATFVGARASMSSDAWLIAHLCAMLGFALLPLGLLALTGRLWPTPGAGAAGVALLSTWLGAALVLPYYGSEDFGLHAIARDAVPGSGIDLLGLVEAIRFNPVPATMFALGLVLLAVGGVAVAVATSRAQDLPRWIGVPAGVGLVLFLPQFFLAPWARIAHGVLLAVGLLLLAGILWWSAERGSVDTSASPETSATTPDSTSMWLPARRVSDVGSGAR